MVWEHLCLRHLKHLYSWERITQKIYIPKKTGKDLTWKRMFDIHEKLIVNNQMKFLECLKLVGKILHGNRYLWSMLKKSSVSRMQRFTYSQILCYVLEKWIRIKRQILFGSNSWFGSKIHHNTEFWIQLTDPMEFECNIFPRFTTLQVVQEVTKFMNKMSAPGQFQGRIVFMSTLSDITWRIKDNEQECITNATLVSLFAKRFPAGRWSLTTIGHKENWRESLNWWWSNSDKADTQFSESRVHCLEERSKAQEVKNYLYTSVPMGYDWNRFSHNYFC